MGGRHRYELAIYAPHMGPLLAPGSGPPPGGAETQLLMLAAALAERGRRVCLVVQAPAPATSEAAPGVDVVAFPPWRPRSLGVPGLAIAPLFAHVWRALGPADAEIVLQRAAGIDTGLVGLAAKARRRRFVYSSGSVVDFDYARLQPVRRNRWLFRLGVRLADELVVQTDEQVELALRAFARSGTLIPSIAPTAPLRSAAPEAFLWIGRLADYKRPLDFVELARRLPDARFWMLGVVTGGVGEDLHARLVAESAALPNLELLEPRPREAVQQLIERAVAVVNTSDYEGMPNTFLEGWARGVPALAHRYDPDGVVARHGLGRFAAGDPDALAAAASELWAGRHDQSALAAACRRYVSERHGPDAVAARWSAVLWG